MRIEVLPSNIAPLPDRKMPNAEEGQEDRSGSTFLDVITQMTAATGQSEETSSENASSPGKGKQDEGSCENSTVAALPAAPVSSEMQPFFSDPNAPAAAEVLSFSKVQDRHVPDHPARVPAADSTANETGEATSDSTPFAASNLTSGVSGTATIPVISWPAVLAPLPPPDGDAAAPRDLAVFSTAVAPEMWEAGVPSDSARGYTMPVPEGSPLNASPAALPERASILGPKAVGLTSPVPRERALQLNLFDLPATSAAEQAGTPDRVRLTATEAAPTQSLLPGDAVPGLQAGSAVVSSAQSSMASLHAAGATPPGDGPALPPSAAHEVLPLRHPPTGAAAGSLVGTPQPETPEGFRKAEPQAGAVEGGRSGRPQVPAPEAFRMGYSQAVGPEGLRVSTQSVAVPEGLRVSTQSIAAPEGLRMSTQSIAAPEGLRMSAQSVAVSEGLRMSTQPVAVSEALRVSTQSVTASEALHISTPQTVPPEGSQIGTAQAAFVEGIHAGNPQAAGTEAFRMSIPPAAVPEELRTNGRQIAVPENPGSECPQDATQGGERLGEPDIAAFERFLRGNPLRIAQEQSHGNSLTAAIPEKPQMSSSHAAGQSREALTDPVLKEAALPFLRESDVSVEVIHSSAPVPREPEVVQPRILPANLMIAVSENTDRNQRQIHAIQAQMPSDPVAPAVVEPVQLTSGEPAENVHPGAGEQQPLQIRLVPELSAPAADVIADLTEAQILLQGGGRPEPLAQSTRPASVFSSSEAPGNAEGRAELPINVSDLDLATPETKLTGRRSDNESEGLAGAKSQPLRRRGQEPAPVDVPERELGRLDSARRMAPMVVPRADLRGDSSGEGNLLDTLNRMLTEAQRAAVETSKDKTAVRPPLPADDAEAAPAEAPEVLPGFAPDALVRANASMAAIHAVLRPVQHSAPTTSIPGATGVPLPVHTAAAEIKALAALLAPKSPAPSQGPDFLAQLAERMQIQLRGGESTMRIQLKPSSLGRIEIKAETTVSGVAATILTESQSVKNYLEHNLHILQQSFQDQGLKIDRIQVTVQEGFWPHHSSSGNQESHSGTGQREEADPTVWQSERVERTVEELALDAHTLALMSPHHTFHTVA